MLKKTILVVAALGAVVFASAGTADAAVRSAHVAHVGRGHLAHAHRVARHAGALHGTRFALRARHGGRRYAGLRGRRAGARHLALAGRDAMIRRYVGPRSAYRTTTTAAGYGVQTGGASYYSGGRTANGGVVGAATCAHRSLPFGTRLLVTNLANAHQMVLTVNDRGPFVAGRILDVSRVAAASLGMLQSGTAPVRIQVVGGPG